MLPTQLLRYQHARRLSTARQWSCIYCMQHQTNDNQAFLVSPDSGEQVHDSLPAHNRLISLRCMWRGSKNPP